jgi:Zn-dependent metalloprotease
MKLFFMLLIVTSCASHKNQNKLVRESYKLEPKTLEEKKVDVHRMLEKHSEFDSATKDKIENILIKSLEVTQKLRIRESQLVQQISNYTIVKKANYQELVKLKAELKNLYNTKYINFETAINNLKDIVGIKEFNDSIMQDIHMEHLLDRQ